MRAVEGIGYGFSSWWLVLEVARCLAFLKLKCLDWVKESLRCRLATLAQA